MFTCIVHFVCFQFTWLAGLAVSPNWLPGPGLHTLSATVLCISCMSLCHCQSPDELYLVTVMLPSAGTSVVWQWHSDVYYMHTKHTGESYTLVASNYDGAIALYLSLLFHIGLIGIKC